ncbi:MAG: purine-nucleoside phosphorylase [Candidatus Gastranaerophilaceae bacterium]|jgi:purine-nucleoside phosphorylase
MINKATDFIKSKLEKDFIPEIGLILGSGLGDIANSIQGIKVPYEEIPGFESSKVQGHAGCLAIGTLAGKNVVAMQGRFHFYEGHTMQKVVFPLKVMKKLGIQKLVVTNAAGGINPDFKPGDLMIITDHINFMGTNPLIGQNDDELGVRFPDMSTAYSKKLIEITKSVANKMGIETTQGVYLGGTGPSYETPTEVKMMRILGADAVGMSTVPEVITANYLGLEVLGISCITNMAAGILDQPLNHEEVIETTNKVKNNFIKLVTTVVQKI